MSVSWRVVSETSQRSLRRIASSSPAMSRSRASSTPAAPRDPTAAALVSTLLHASPNRRACTVSFAFKSGKEGAHN